MQEKSLYPWGALSGIYLTGNGYSNSCSDVSLVNNTLRYSKIYYEQPCGTVLIKRNKISRTAIPIQVGSYENLIGLNLAKDVLVTKNQIRETLGGILIRGCDFNDKEPRCRIPSARVQVVENNFDSFLPLEGTGADSWVNLMSRSGKSLSAIVTSDASYVTIESNQISGLRSGSQVYGISVQSSRWNAWYADSSKDCYAPILASRGIDLSQNSISFSPLTNENVNLGLSGKQNVGIYVENADNVVYAPGTFERVDSNRLIRATLATNSDASAFCSAPSGGATDKCRRRLDPGRLLMLDACLRNPAWCEFRIPGIPASENAAEFSKRYSNRCTASAKDPEDEEFQLPN